MQFESQIFERDWSKYYNAVIGCPPRDTLLAALEMFEPDRKLFAVDLGCGEGRDTVELLRRGWQVLAVDGNGEAIARMLARSDINPELLTTQTMQFEQLVLPTAVDLINASFSLPFCPPEQFPHLWEKIVTSLKPGGRFCGQLFGDRDSWAIYTSMNHHTRAQIETLLQPFDVEMLQEEEHPGKTAIGEEKYWHIFHIVARRR
jgi:SAM-dependent methyltransferase